MPEVTSEVRIRPLDELDLSGIVRIDEKIGGRYRPEIWEQRVMFYTRRDPGASQVAEANGRVIGFMLGDCRAGEFGLEEPSGWIERFGIDPEFRGQDIGRRMFDAMCAHFRAEGATRVRTLVDRNDPALAGFLGAIGFRDSALTALERTI
ncbi:MAG TPA: GNAT family N-acetyltransferase [Candidatus Acidoferrales bacterium]|nr:GNAT family N-acetyltransferase [Candidatus Acidoferrales bacterium]